MAGCRPAFGFALRKLYRCWCHICGATFRSRCRTAKGKPGSPLRSLYIGTLAPAGPGGWWHQLIEGGTRGSTYVQALQGDPETWDRWPTIRKANPLTAISAPFREKFLEERDAARRDSRLKARFLSYRLNLPTADESTMLLTVDDWQRVTARPVPERDGAPIVGIDLGGGRAWSAAVALFRSGRVEALALAPGVPDLEAQEKRDRVQRLFGPGIMDTLGVRMDSVPSGRSEWPLITAGVVPTQKAEGIAADADAAATFTTEVLKPKRLTGRYEFTHEMSAQIVDLEQGLRRDLADAVMAKTSDRIVNGDEATDAQDVDGFATTIAAPGNAAAVAEYADFAGAHAPAVDGIHASSEGEVSSVIGTDVYRFAANTYQVGSGESGSEALRRRGMSCMASPYVGSAANSGHHKLNLFHAAGSNGGAMRGDSVAAMWPTLEIIRDIYSQASQGVTLTWVTLWDAQTAFRAAAYQRLAFDIIA